MGSSNEDPVFLAARPGPAAAALRANIFGALSQLARAAAQRPCEAAGDQHQPEPTMTTARSLLELLDSFEKDLDPGRAGGEVSCRMRRHRIHWDTVRSSDRGSIAPRSAPVTTPTLLRRRAPPIDP